MSWILGILVLLWLGVNLLVAWIATHPPRTPAVASPGILGAPQESVTIKSDELIELSAWWVPGSHPTSVAILSHGYILSKGELTPVAYALWQKGVSCLLIDFRGHGKSDAGLCTFGYRESRDVLAAMEWVKKQSSNARIVLIGSSMGSVASAIAWSEHPEMADALVLDSAYGNLGKAINGWWRFMGGWLLVILLWPVAYLAVLLLGFNPFDVKTSEYLERLKGRPMLFMHGTEDIVASAKSAGKNLFAMGPDTPAVWFSHCGHSEGRWEQPETYRTALLAFLEANGFFEPKDQEFPTK